MDTRTLCLGVLSDGPASGYEIKKAVEEHFAYFLDISHSAIYPALADMRSQGLVECELVRQDRKPDKKVYYLTDIGREAFVRGLMASQGRHRPRSEFVGLMIFSEHLPNWRIQQLIDERLSEWRAMLERAQRPPANRQSDTPGVRFSMGLCTALLEAGITYLESNRQWLESAAEQAPGEDQE